MSSHQHSSEAAIKQPNIETVARAIAEIAAPTGELGTAATAIAIAGAPGSGKSTFADALSSHLAAHFHITACVVPMDGFHLDNAVLTERGLLSVKGAPESFDHAGFARLVSALKDRQTTYFPTFDRDQDAVIANGGQVPDTSSILLFEGNYLLFDEPEWAALAALWDASIWLNVPTEILQTRLVQRWRDHGLSAADARTRAMSNDLPNARRINDNVLPATWVLSPL